MKNLKNFFLNKFLFLILFLFITTPVFPELKNNEKLNHITSKLRCMTCQNQTIYESETEFSKQIKTEILEQLNNNKNEEEIIEFIIQRYGEYVLLKPKFDKIGQFFESFFGGSVSKLVALVKDGDDFGFIHDMTIFKLQIY